MLPVIEPDVPPLPIWSVPALIVVPPVKLLVPVSVVVSPPSFSNVPLPEMEPA